MRYLIAQQNIGYYDIEITMKFRATSIQDINYIADFEGLNNNNKENNQVFIRKIK